MPSESGQHALDRVRKPRVHITYDVQVGDAKQLRELPFVVGVLADLSGKPETPLPKVKERKFVDVDQDNFDKVVEAVSPRLAFQVENTLQNDGSKLNVELRFSKLDDFHPEQIVAQIHALRELIEIRNRLMNLLNKMDGNDKLESLLQQVINDSEALKKLRDETARDESRATGGQR